MRECKTRFPSVIIILYFFQMIIFLLLVKEDKDSTIPYLFTFLLLLGVFFVISYLEVKIDKTGVSYYFFPLFRRSVSFSEIKKVSFGQYSGFSFGVGFRKKLGISYLLSFGGMMTIEKKNGKIITLSIDDTQEFLNAFRSYDEMDIVLEG